MSKTSGLNHLGLTVRDLDETTGFFTGALGWTETARDPAYPRSTVTDGALRLTLWQAFGDQIVEFDRATNIGLHHLALEVETEAQLQNFADTLPEWPGVEIEFLPEPMGNGPRQHMMLREPGGLRIELLWPGQPA